MPASWTWPYLRVEQPRPAPWPWPSVPKPARCLHGLLPTIAKPSYTLGMPTMNISLPEPLRNFVEEQIAERRYGTTSEYVRDLIRRDQDRQHLRGLLMAGAGSESGPVADDGYFDDLRDGVDAATDG